MHASSKVCKDENGTQRAPQVFSSIHNRKFEEVFRCIISPMLAATTVSSFVKHKSFIVSALSEKASNAIAQDQQRYFKNVLRFRGLKAPVVDAVYQSIMQDKLLKQLRGEEQVELALDMLQSEFAEDKRIGNGYLYITSFTFLTEEKCRNQPSQAPR
jgi:hypothetical protein